METGKEVVKINLNNIIPNRFQPRISFDEQALNELATSIKMYGILQPLILRPLGDKYEIIAGERRYKAATMAGLSEVPAILVNLDDQTSAELAIIENIQRKDLTSIEEAKSYQKLLDLGNLTQDQLATKMGKNQSTIANKLRLLSLSKEVQDALLNNSISERHARSLLQLKDDLPKQKEVLDKIIKERLTVKDTDELIKKIIGGVNDMDINVNNENNSDNNNNNSDLQASIEKGYNEISANLNQENIPLEPNQDSINLNEVSNPNFNVSAFNQEQNNNVNMTPSIDELLNQNKTTTETETEMPPTDATIQNQDLMGQTPDFDSLLKVEEKKEEEEKPKEPPLPQIGQPITSNKFFPSFEEEPANLSFANPFAPQTPTKEENQKSDEFDALMSNNSLNLDNNNSENEDHESSQKDITQAINNTKDMVNNLTSLGYKVDLEELDLGNTYQITIKIDKSN